MRSVKFLAAPVLLACLVLLAGCQDPCSSVKGLNATQQQKIASLESQLAAAQLEADQNSRQLDTLRSRGDVASSSLQQQIAALETALREKNAIIGTLNAQLLKGGTPLPPELTSTLREFAANSDMITFDEGTGVVKFKSDLLFDRGSANLSPEALTAIRQLVNIMNSSLGNDFDIVVAGHTDDMPIRRPETLAKHPDNWHLSAHRGISVLSEMIKSGMSPQRMSVRAFGEFRTAEPNQAQGRGNPVNRRVEIYIVPKGV